jgi:hypothetical protein
MEEHSRPLHERLPVSLILAVSMIAAGVVYPVTDSALKHTSPIMIATLRALVGGLILTIVLPLLRSRPGSARARARSRGPQGRIAGAGRPGPRGGKASITLASDRLGSAARPRRSDQTRGWRPQPSPIR